MFLKGVKDRFYCSRSAPAQQAGSEQFCFREIKRKDALVGAFYGFDRIHFHKIHFVGMGVFKIGIGPAPEHFPVLELCAVDFSGFKLYLSFQVNVSGQENPPD